MKIYISCDIEGVAGLSSWEEARSAQSLYQAAAAEMSAEAAACARGAFAAGASRVVVEDGHGDGRNINISALPSRTELVRGITHDVFGVTGVFDDSFDALLFIGFHAAASSPGNPTSHTMVSSRIASLHVNGALWGEFEVGVHAAALRGVPVWFLSGDAATCACAQALVPGVSTVATKEGVGYSVLSRTPEAVLAEIEARTLEALTRPEKPTALVLPDHFSVEVAYLHHYDAKNAAHYPGARLHTPCVVRFESDDYAEVLRFFHFVI